MDINITILLVLLLFANLMMIPGHLFNMEKSGKKQLFWAEQFKEVEWYGKILIILINIFCFPAILFNIVMITLVQLIQGGR